MVRIYRKADLEALEAAKVSLTSQDLTGQIIELEQLNLFRELMAGRSPQKAPRARRPRETQVQRTTRELQERMDATQRLLQALDKISPRKNPRWAILETPFVQGIIRGAAPGLLELGRELIREKLSSFSGGSRVDESGDFPVPPARKPIVEPTVEDDEPTPWR